MNGRRIVSLLLCMFFAGMIAIGILLIPIFRVAVGIKNESLLRWIHMDFSIIFLILTCIHATFNRKALGNYLQKARGRSIIAFTVSGLLFVCILWFGLVGPELRINVFSTKLQLTGQVKNITEDSITLDIKGVNKVVLTDDTKCNSQQGNAKIADIQKCTSGNLKYIRCE